MMQPASGSSMGPGGSITQLMKIDNPTCVPIKLRCKLGYTCNGSLVNDMIDFSGFDTSLWS
jgi:AP-1 complex subunit gamma-1